MQIEMQMKMQASKDVRIYGCKDVTYLRMCGPEGVTPSPGPSLHCRSIHPQILSSKDPQIHTSLHP
jgi:hypothetical protein